MVKPGVRQVTEGSGEQETMEKTGSKIICGAPTTLAVKELMIMMMMMMMICNVIGITLVSRFVTLLALLWYCAL